MTSQTRHLKKLVSNTATYGGAHRPVRAKTMLATLFGDLVSAHGSQIWLSDLIRLAAVFQINERQVRTSVFRLVEEGWLTKKRHGRRSKYSLSTEGQEQTALAQELLYHYQPRPWNGTWDLVIATSTDISSQQQLQLRQRLTLMGFGILSKNIYAHPDMDNTMVSTVISDLALTGRVVVMASSFIAPEDKKVNAKSNEEMISQCCNYDEAEKNYAQFLSLYQEIPGVISNAVEIDDRDCFCVQMYLMHDYRRILFKDPQLPDELLPENWIGIRARETVKAIYQKTCQGTNTFYQSLCNSDGIKQALDASFYERFGGLL